MVNLFYMETRAGWASSNRKPCLNKIYLTHANMDKQTLKDDDDEDNDSNDTKPFYVVYD